MKKKTESSQQRVTKKLKEWLTPQLEEKLGQQDLNEYLWMTSILWENLEKDQGSLSTKEYRQLLIKLTHHWISLNRRRIIDSWNHTLYSMDVVDRELMEWRPFETIADLRNKSS